MILTDTEILARIESSPPAIPLLTNVEDANVQNCGYILRAGKVFAPQSGDEELLTGNGLVRRHVWEIGPSETLIVMTEETVKMPEDLCATYAPLNRLARQGVMLLNAAVVEPGYEGPLSCFLLNFSSHRVPLGPKSPIAKIVFHTLAQAPARFKPEVMDQARYEGGLAESAKKFQKSFLDVAGIEDRAAQKAKVAIEEAKDSVKKSILAAGVFVAFLLGWASVEPVISKWLWEKTGVATSPQKRIDDATFKRDLEAAQEAFKLQSEKMALENQIREIKAEVEKLKTQINSGTRK